MAKAFESLFGSVTCLPGCFTLYRLRTPDTHKPLFVANPVVQDYSENRVDTLHMKNLLHLGEDRYLTTLLLKHFPNYKTQFVRDAHAYTVAPEEWSILLSQRRRWINSTIHNLGELVFLDRLCGFCCFSMRFVVFIDLLSTIVQPVSVAYVSSVILSLRLLFTHRSDRISDISCRHLEYATSFVFNHHAGIDLRSSGCDLHHTPEMGHGWLDDILYPRHPCVFIPSSLVFLLANG